MLASDTSPVFLDSRDALVSSIQASPPSSNRFRPAPQHPVSSEFMRCVCLANTSSFSSWSQSQEYATISPSKQAVMPLPLFSLDLRGALASSIQAHLFLVTKHPPLVLAATTSTTRKKEKQPEIQQMKQTAKAEKQNNQSNKATSEYSKTINHDKMKSMMRTYGTRLKIPSPLSLIQIANEESNKNKTPKRIKQPKQSQATIKSKQRDKT
jgi:hypothetical protein